MIRDEKNKFTSMIATFLGSSNRQMLNETRHGFRSLIVVFIVVIMTQWNDDDPEILSFSHFKTTQISSSAVSFLLLSLLTYVYWFTHSSHSECAIKTQT